MGKKRKARRSGRSSTISAETEQRARASSRIPTLVWYAAVVVTSWSFGYAIIQAGDLWWHLATGRWIVEHLAIPFTDPWSFTAGSARWVVDAWLSDVMFYAWIRLFGMMSLVWWKWLVLIGLSCFLFRLLARLWDDHAAAFVATAMAGATAAPFWDIRPQLYSMLGLVVLLDLALGRKRPSWLIVPLFLLWANLHAGFTFGLMVLVIVLVPFLRDPGERRRTVSIGTAAVVVCFVNPNTYRVFTQPLLYALDSDSPFQTIGEWLPPFQPGGISSSFYPWAIGVFAVATMWSLFSRRIPVPWVAIGLGALTLAMSLQSRRFVPFFALAMTVVVTPLIRTLLRPILERLPAAVPSVAALVIGVALLWPFPQRSYAFHYLTGEYAFPIETVDFIEQNDIEGKIFAYWPWGGYLHLRTDGGLRVFIDGRASALFDEVTYIDYVQVLEGRPGWIGVLDRSGADYFLWPLDRRERAQELRESGRWRGLTADHLSMVFVRADRAPSFTRETSESPYKHLSLGVLAFRRASYDQAERELRAALDMAPWESRACDWLARALAARGDLDGGRKVVRNCQKIFPMEHRDSLLDPWERADGSQRPIEE